VTSEVYQMKVGTVSHGGTNTLLYIGS